MEWSQSSESIEQPRGSMTEDKRVTAAVPAEDRSPCIEMQWEIKGDMVKKHELRRQTRRV